MKKEVSRWIEQADEELDTAKIDYQAGKYFAAAFWCQQAAEKAFKGLLIEENNTFPRIHDLVRLARLVKAPTKLVKAAAELNPAYTAARYPDTPRQFTKKETEKGIKNCREVVSWVKKKFH
jgi:HEPN domain-containing protein